MCSSAQNCSPKTSPAAHSQNGPAQERLDEELSYRQERSERGNLNAVGWAKPAQPSSRPLYARPPLRSSTRINLARKAKPSASTAACRILNRGPAAVYSGANSIASALRLLNGRDP